MHRTKSKCFRQCVLFTNILARGQGYYGKVGFCFFDTIDSCEGLLFGSFQLKQCNFYYKMNSQIIKIPLQNYNRIKLINDD